MSNLFRLFGCGLWLVGLIGLVAITIQAPRLKLVEDQFCHLLVAGVDVIEVPIGMLDSQPACYLNAALLVELAFFWRNSRCWL